MYQPESKIDKNYHRVIPRDLFNDAKLLKCIGRLVILIHDGYGLNNMIFEYDGSPFKIERLDEGSLFIANITFKIKETELFFKTQYNSKENYPLMCEYDRCEYEVFDYAGYYTEEFVEFCKQITANP